MIYRIAACGIWACSALAFAGIFLRFIVLSQQHAADHGSTISTVIIGETMAFCLIVFATAFIAAKLVKSIEMLRDDDYT